MSNELTELLNKVDGDDLASKVIEINQGILDQLIMDKDKQGFIQFMLLLHEFVKYKAEQENVTLH